MSETSRHLSEFGVAVMEGMAKPQKTLPPKFLYDHNGSQLFDRICDCPEYYITRTEMEILEENMSEVNHWTGDRSVILELGSGASRKTQLLLKALPRAAAYVPIDISPEILFESASKLISIYPGLSVRPVCADFTTTVSIPWQAPR